MSATDFQHHPRRLLILYGSQTGNAQDVAERVAREAVLRLYAPVVLPMDSYPLQQLPGERCVVCIAATTGQGDPPDNMRRFWKLLLRKSLPPDSLAGVHYAVFGLGDSGYVKYNVAAKKLDRRLAALGAAPLLERGLGDDQHPSGYEATLDPWLQQLWPVLRAHTPLPPGITEPALDAAALLQLGPAKYRITPVTPPPGQLAQQQEHVLTPPHLQEQLLQQQAVEAAAAFRAVAAEAAGLPAAAQDSTSTSSSSQTYGPWRPFLAPLLVNRRVTAADHFQETRHLEFGLTGSGLDAYQPGDLLAVFPRTPAADVEAALQRLGLDGDAWVRVEAAAPPACQQQHPADGEQQQQQHGGAVCVAPIRALVQGVLDLSGASPRRYLFQVLAAHTAGNTLQRERLEYFAAAEGRDDLYRYNQKERRSLLEVLQDFSSAQPPLERLLEAAPLLQPRLFSLASAPAAHGTRAAILAAVVRWRTASGRPRKGLLTNWLAGLSPAAAACSSSGDAAGVCIRVPVWVERGAFRLPPNPQTPLVLVGPGTGVAPFRSFCWHRAAEAAAAAAAAGQAAAAPSDSCLFFGCRSPSADLYYASEWWPLMQGGALHPQHGTVVAFSRHQPQPSQAQLLQLLQQQAAAAGVVTAKGQHEPALPEQREQREVEKPASSRGVYVTHKLREHGAAVWRLLSQQGAWVFVSGSAEKMPAGVVAALEDVAAQHGGLSADDAAKFVRQLELSGCYHVEAWS